MGRWYHKWRGGVKDGVGRWYHKWRGGVKDGVGRWGGGVGRWGGGVHGECVSMGSSVWRWYMHGGEWYGECRRERVG